MLAFLRKVLQRKQERSRICSFVADRCSKPPQELEHKIAEEVRIATLDEERSRRGLLNCWAGAREKARQVRGELSVFKVRGGCLAARQIRCRSRRSGAGRAACRPSGRFGPPTAGVRACPGIRRIRTCAGSARARHCALQLRLPLGVFAVRCSRNASGTGAAAR